MRQRELNESEKRQGDTTITHIILTHIIFTHTFYS